LERLRAAGVATDVLERLKSLEHQEATGETAFLERVTATIGPEHTAQNRALILQYAHVPAPAGSRLSLVIHTPTALDLIQPLAGLLIDEWSEVVPHTEETTGLAFHYNAPAARAPQAILLAVTPDDRPTWDLACLEATVLETLELAKLRTVDLTALETVGQFLPALYFANNASGATIATDFAPMAQPIEPGR
jgi:hypothetical protein